MWLKSKIQRDERMRSNSNKVLKEAYIIAIAICGVSIITKSYLYDFKPETFISEVAIVLITTIYSLLRVIKLGIYADEAEMHDRNNPVPLHVKNIIIGLIFGVVISLFFGIRSAVLYGDDTNRIFYFFLVSLASLMIYCPFLAGFMAVTDFFARQASPQAEDEQ